MEDKLQECDNCSFITKTAHISHPGGQDCDLCRVCSSTYLGFATAFPDQVLDVRLYKSIAWIANHIRQEIEKHNVIIPR